MISRNKRKENDLSKPRFERVKRVLSVVCAIVITAKTDELTRLAFMFFLIFILAAALNLIGCASINSTDRYDLDGICALDFETNNCWVEKKRNQGFSFGELQLQNSRCEQGPPDLCWFAINHIELTKLLRARDRLKDLEGE